MTTFDFGYGPIPAHQHTNPDGTVGGWVADSTKIGSGVWIQPTATVGNYSRIGDGSSVGNYSSLGNYSSVGNYSRIGDRSKIGNFSSLGNDSSVGNYSRIGDGSSLGDRSSLGNDSSLGDRSSVGDGTVWAESPPYAICGRWIAYMFDKTTVKIDCQDVDLTGNFEERINQLKDEFKATNQEFILALSFCTACAALTP